MHSLLKRQLRRHLPAGDEGAAPLQSFVSAVDEAYQAFDDDRAMLERSLDISSRELLQANSDIRALFQAMPDTFFRLDDQGKILEVRGNTLPPGLSTQNVVGSLISESFPSIGEQLLSGVREVQNRHELVTLQLATPYDEQTYEARLLPLLEQEVMLIVRDITARRRAEVAAARSSELLKAATMESTADGILVTSLGAGVTYYNSRFLAMWGASADVVESNDLGQLTKTLLVQIRDPESFVRRADELNGTMEESYETVAFKDGRVFERYSRPLLDADGVAGRVWSFRDVTERERAANTLRESEERFRSLVQNASDLITVIDPATKLLYQSPSSSHVLGYQPDEMQGCQLVHFIHRDDLSVLLNFTRDVMKKSGEPLSIELRLQHKDGSSRAMEIVGTDQRTNQSIGGIVLNIRDIGERKALEEQLRQQAFSDVLTGLANRARFTDHLQHGLLRSKRERTTVGVVFLDLDDFKAVNDSLGHAAGDALLIAVGGRLLRCVRPGDTVARFGGDEFAVLLEDASGANEAVNVAGRIVDALRPPFEIEGRQWFVRASLGVSLTASGQVSADDLMRNADVAMYVAKGRGKGRFELYEESMHDALMERVELLGGLQEAISSDESQFVVQYQPVLRLETGAIVGMEALVRWQHSERGLLPPDQFISLAEESGAILAIGRSVLREACSQVRLWQTKYASTPRLTVAVNVSVRQLQHPGFVQEVRDALAASGLDPEDLVLEITESVMMQDVEATTARLRELKSVGVKLAIDDFGTGYSSLSYLRQFPLDILKIDKSFVSTMRQSIEGNDLTRAIVQIGKTLALETVAEGIEQIEQLAALRSLGCDLGQGYYFARPLWRDQMNAYLDSAIRARHAA